MLDVFVGSDVGVIDGDSSGTSVGNVKVVVGKGDGNWVGNSLGEFKNLVGTDVGNSVGVVVR